MFDFIKNFFNSFKPVQLVQPTEPVAAPKKAAKKSAKKIKCERCGKSVVPATYKKSHGDKCKKS